MIEIILNLKFLVVFHTNQNIKFIFPNFFHCSVPKNKRRRKADRRHDGRDRRGDYYEEASPTAAGSSSHPHRDARYTDMAPKWV